jgi:hypothetical protein
MSAKAWILLSWQINDNSIPQHCCKLFYIKNLLPMKSSIKEACKVFGNYILAHVGITNTR